ncbi:Fbp Fructose-1,6-bisphosphatase [Pyrenophora tritici-repentis]|uniref:N-terminal domain containing protein n=3 Tax=Pyrenophora tritici-repentis TaxID=45151 RepID=A0A2W1G4D8_9PLEO|nr:sedoheptulose-1,7-bisphosphatase [Pyrenophora tritici-repentis Pt-1C-BFP]KAG9381316.1 Fbp Fructose-1,6-bisphosphatase [Pyrenophora tritici-repentis]EDU43612.1 sedoheptulose-1,7-bisphosphatase [Pyrenophora tritici-repentis Pt-1C-BFP]KAI0606176.1 Fbp Fructose-1-6-bisphosphatase [Pyrenophora tritici-repentis]KAI1516574.1 N-terminal domain containing protein [Pyrenophora tritici-repentis]KAI1671213.1 N-terminal domain containing protein [Pyrenophora tritici-repentis]
MSSSDLTYHLHSHISSSHPQLRDSVLPSLLSSIHTIAGHLRTSPSVTQVGTANAFGDDQLNVDVLAEEAIRKTIASCPAIVTASSEEDPIEKSSPPSNEATKSKKQYTLAFDPLDGSSIIAPNWSVGTIIGIWDGPSALHQNPDEAQIASILGVLGPRTTAIVALRLPGSQGTCFEVGYSDDGTVEVIRKDIKLSAPPFKTRYFAPANMRAAAESPAYLALINNFITQKYTLRYSGGLVPDVVHALVKGHGVYVSPVTAQSKAKLRRLYELAPIALIVECAGGMALDSATGKRVLETSVEDTDERGGLICGNTEEVEAVKKALLG